MDNLETCLRHILFLHTLEYDTIITTPNSFFPTLCCSIYQLIVGASAEEALNLMTSAACLINKTLNDVLLLHAIEEGSLKLIKKPFHFQEVLKSSMKYAQSLADKSMIVMELEGPQEDDIKTSLLVGDRLRLENVIRSLLMNAVQSSFPRSVVTIKISIQFRDAH